MSEVGVIVCGVGIAGGVRLRDIARSSEYESAYPILQGVQLKGFCSRREVALDGHTRLDFKEALTRSDVHCVLVCTDSADHEESARQALSAGKNVLVEFPLARTYAAGKELFDLAEANGVKLAEENIQLLTEGMKEVLTAAKIKTLQKAFMGLKTKFNRWNSDMSVTGSGSVFINNIHYLHSLLLVCGPLQPRSATLTVNDNGDLLARAILTTKDNFEVELQLEYCNNKEVGRTSSYKFEFTDGTVITNPPPVRPTPPVPPKAGLFMEDFIAFIGAMRGTTQYYLPSKVSLEALKLADQLHSLSQPSP